MKLAICEGNRERQERLCACVQAVMENNNRAYTLHTYECTEKLLCDIEDGECFDVLFLEASFLARESGAFFALLRQKGCTSPIVLTSTQTAAAVDGYEWGVNGFLLYPYDSERVKRLLSRLRCDTACRWLTVQRRRTITRVPFEDILFAESRNTRCVIHCRHGVEHTVYAQLDDIENRLCDPRFLRCHQSYLVNMDHVVKVDASFIVEGGATVSIRQRDLRRIRDYYLAYTESKENVNRV